MKNNYLFLILTLISQFAFSQTQEKKIHGKITAGKNSVDAIEIMNFSNGTMASTNSEGHFYIWAKPNDVLIFSNTNFEYKRKKVTTQEFDSGEIKVEMTPKVTQLDEVLVNKNDNLNASDLGISSATKVYTPAERKLRTASKPIELIQGLGFSNDALFNALSGRTSMLKKGVQVEKKEAAMEKLDDLFDDNYFVDNLGIPKEHVKGFKFYIVNDASLVQAVEANNKVAVEAKLIGFAEEYIQILADEK